MEQKATGKKKPYERLGKELNLPTPQLLQDNVLDFLNSLKSNADISISYTMPLQSIFLMTETNSKIHQSITNKKTTSGNYI